MSTLTTHVAMDATSLTIAVLTLAAGSLGIVFALYRQLAALEVERKREREEHTRLAEKVAALEARAKASEALHVEVHGVVMRITEWQTQVTATLAALDKQMEWVMASPYVRFQTVGPDGKPVPKF